MRALSRLLTLAALSLGLVVGASTLTLAADGGVPLPHPAKAFKGDKCVEDSGVMRRNHFDYLKHQRDETLRDGIRGNKYSLSECIACHATTSPDVAGGKLRTIKPFCAECHSYAAVKIDCFECHTGTAKTEGE